MSPSVARDHSRWSQRRGAAAEVTERSEGNPLAGLTAKAAGPLQRRHRSGMVFEATDSGDEPLAIGIAAATRGGRLYSGAPPSFCVRFTASARLSPERRTLHPALPQCVDCRDWAVRDRVAFSRAGSRLKSCRRERMSSFIAMSPLPAVPTGQDDPQRTACLADARLRPTR